MSETQKQLDYEDIEIRGRMDIEDIVRLQINRCNASAYEPDQTLFESSVKVLLDLLPKHERIRVIANQLDEKEGYIESKVFVEYGSYWCGKPMTSTMRKVKRPVIDFHKLYRIVLDAFADSGLTWQIEPILVGLGKKESRKTIPNPYLIDKKEVKKDEPGTNS